MNSAADNVPYRELGSNFVDQLDREKVERRLISKLQLEILESLNAEILPPTSSKRLSEVIDLLNDGIQKEQNRLPSSSLAAAERIR